MSMSQSVYESFSCAKVFHDIETGLNFNKPGTMLLAHDAKWSTLYLYDCVKGVRASTHYSFKYGCSVPCFGAAEGTVLCAGFKNGWDSQIRYWSLQENKYIRYFKGHTNDVSSIKMSPDSDAFLSASHLDSSIRFWDLRSHSCKGLLRCSPGAIVVDWDPSGMVFGATLAGDSLGLYDLRQYQRGPFTSLTFEYDDAFSVSSLSFSRDGEYICCGTTSNAVFLVDAMTGDLRHIFQRPNDSNDRIQASFSMDSKFVFSGSSEGKLYGWSVASGEAIFEKEDVGATAHNGDQQQPEAVLGCAWNPGLQQMCSSTSHSVTLWTPNYVVTTEQADQASAMDVVDEQAEEAGEL